MNPFNLFVLLALLGALVAVGAVVVSECRDAELVVLPATVLDKVIVAREKTVTTTQPASSCTVCPGSATVTVTSVVHEETFFVILDVVEGGESSPRRLEVSGAFYQQLRVGDAVEWRVLRGKTSGRLCSHPEILVLEPAR